MKNQYIQSNMTPSEAIRMHGDDWNPKVIEWLYELETLREFKTRITQSLEQAYHNSESASGTPLKNELLEMANEIQAELERINL